MKLALLLLPMLFLLLTAAFSIDKICELCVKWGTPALEMARAGATPEQIRPIAERKCSELKVYNQLYAKFCEKVAIKMLPKLLAEARGNNMTAQEYCVQKKIC